MTVYADNAATTKMCPAAVAAMRPFFDELFANPSGLYAAGMAAAQALEEARRTVADCIGCRAEEIIFTSGGSEADNQAILSAAEYGARRGKRHIISTAIEHHAVLHTLKKLERQGFRITLLPVYEEGIVRLSDLENALDDETALVSVMYANNEIGTIQPVAQIGALLRERGILFHSDAVQAVGHIPVDVKKDGIDMLSLSAHKFGGPKGIGVLYARKGVPVSSLIEGGAQERGKRAGTENVAAIAGMAAALQESCAQMATAAVKTAALRDRLIKGLLQIPHTVLNGDAERRLPGNVNVCFEGIEGESLILLLSDAGICASSGSACTSGSLDPSHVLIALGRPHDVAHGSLRLTLSAENTEEEVDYVCSAVKAAVERLRAMSPVWKDLQEGKRRYVIQ